MQNYLEPYYTLRSQLLEVLRKELLGPANGNTEALSDLPSTRYLCGVLYPSGTPIDLEQHLDEAEEDGELGTYDPPVSLANVRYPSSMGMTFSVDVTVGEIEVDISAARYLAHTPSMTAAMHEVPKVRQSTSDTEWQREPIELPTQKIDTSTPGNIRTKFRGLDMGAY